MPVSRSIHVVASEDCHAAAQFFVDLLRFETTWKLDGMFHEVASGPCVIRFGTCRGMPQGPDLKDHRYFAYIVVDDLQGLLPALRAGGHLKSEPKDEPWGVREAPVETPDGRRIMLAQVLAPGT